MNRINNRLLATGASLAKRIQSFLIRHRITLVAVCIFLTLASALTWPFIIHPTSTQVGANYGDIFASISKFDAIKNEGNNPFFDGHLYSLAYPDSVRSNVGVDRVSFFSTLFLWVFTLVINATFAHSMCTFLGYFISAFIMYLFIRKHTTSTTLGLIAGAAFITFPLFISLARAAPVYMWSWLYILPVWAMIELTRSYSTKKLILAGLSIIPGIFWTPYFMLHVLLVAFACLITYVLLYIKRHKTIPFKQAAFLMGVVALVAALYVMIGYSSSSTVVPDRPISDAYEQSLNPLMLLTPSANTAITYPIYDTFIKDIQPRGNDVVLFAGFTVCILSLIGTLALFGAKKLNQNMRILGYFGVAIIMISLAFSLAPTITLLGIEVPTPNYLVVHFVPALRAGQRLAVPIMLGLIMTAVIGIHYLSQRLHRHIRPSILLTCITLLIGVEYVTVFDQMTAPVHTSTAMSRLALAPKGIVAEYINNSLTSYPGQLACKNYLIHHQQTVNSCSLDIYTDPGKWPVIEYIDKLHPEDQIAYLRRIDVKYVIIDKSSSAIEAILQSRGSRALEADSKFKVYMLD